MIDWNAIKTEYIVTDQSYRTLSKKYKVGFSRLSQIAAEEKWREERKKYRENVVKNVIQKTAEKTSEENANRIELVMKISDGLVEAVNRSMKELMQEQQIDTYKLRQIIQSLKDLKEIQTSVSTDESNPTGGIVLLSPVIEENENG